MKNQHIRYVTYGMWQTQTYSMLHTVCGHWDNSGLKGVVNSDYVPWIQVYVNPMFICNMSYVSFATKSRKNLFYILFWTHDLIWRSDLDQNDLFKLDNDGR